MKNKKLLIALIAILVLVAGYAGVSYFNGGLGKGLTKIAPVGTITKQVACQGILPDNSIPYNKSTFTQTCDTIAKVGTTPTCTPKSMSFQYASDNKPGECKYICNTGYIFSNNKCLKAAPSCTGTDPTYATMCAYDNTGLTADTAKTVVSSCTDATKCEFTCYAGFTKSGNGCVPSTLPCSGTIPSGSNMIVGASSYTTPYLPSSWTYISSVTPSNCQFTCNAGYTFNATNNTCIQPLTVTFNLEKTSYLKFVDDFGIREHGDFYLHVNIANLPQNLTLNDLVSKWTIPNAKTVYGGLGNNPLQKDSEGRYYISGKPTVDAHFIGPQTTATFDSSYIDPNFENTHAFKLELFTTNNEKLGEFTLTIPPLSQERINNASCTKNSTSVVCQITASTISDTSHLVWHVNNNEITGTNCSGQTSCQWPLSQYPGNGNGFSIISITPTYISEFLGSF